jgi:nucleoside-diphosphate-sugar epimerase
MSIIDMKNRRIAIIGGAGFIGHNLALCLKRLGAHVEVIDGLEVNSLMSLMSNRDSVPHPQLSMQLVNERLRLLQEAGIPVHVQDAREYHELSHLLTSIKPQVLVHLAAVSHANRSNKNPFMTFDHSLRTLENALDWSRGHAEHFVFLSSSMVYGDFKEPQVDETTICEPLGIYGALKYAAEKIIIAYNQVFDLPYTIIRPSALYGERCISRRVGQIFIESALFGEPIDMAGGGAESLDFTYIDDLTDGIARVISNTNSRNEIFNLTYGKACSVADMAAILKEHFPEVSIRSVERDNLMPARGTLCVDKARELIGYNPAWPLQKGYPRYIEWYRELFQRLPKTQESIAREAATAK